MVKIEKYAEDVSCVSNLSLDWEMLKGKTVLISGASGLIGTFLIDVLMEKKIGIQIIALGRDEEQAKIRFARYWDCPEFLFVKGDINKTLELEMLTHVDYVIHAASNTHPLMYSSDPIGTLMTNLTGTKNLLDVAVQKKCKRFVFLSSVEIYGENRGDVDYFDEAYCGYIDCNTLRAGYPEGKRAGESLCQAYRKMYGIEVVIPRLARCYGPTMKLSDTKAISQFIKKGIAGEDIVLKSEGNQLYSYTYVADAVSGILTILMRGKDGEAYNIADPESDITLKDLANMIAAYVGKKVVFEIPDVQESAGYSKATKALMSSHKLKTLGWKAGWTMEDGICRTLEILK
ncbi:NAD-dependent epimerase/dehydratase family protein [Oscillospiraceae bacterium NTUH-002-81]|nr:NAD-dependent epimerase/dehydratase family protein [Oscillospiraceae bacterium NTUH-002-81]